jgi:hypothetical protein
MIIYTLIGSVVITIIIFSLYENYKNNLQIEKKREAEDTLRKEVYLASKYLSEDKFTLAMQHVKNAQNIYKEQNNGDISGEEYAPLIEMEQMIQAIILEKIKSDIQSVKKLFNEAKKLYESQDYKLALVALDMAEKILPKELMSIEAIALRKIISDLQMDINRDISYENYQ